MEFEDDAFHYIDDFNGIQAITWVDPDFYVRWVVPKLGNEEAINLNLGVEERHRQALEDARNRMTPTMSKPVQLVQGGKGLQLYIPIFVQDRFDGFLLTVFRTQEWLEHALRNSRSLHEFEDYEIAIDIDGELVFETPGFKSTPYAEWEVSQTILYYDHRFRISVVPTDHMFVHKDGIAAEIIALAFALFGSILSCLVYYLQKASRASKQAEEVNRVLADESRDRLIAEKKANAANEAKTKFLAAMSHEIRTPLNAVLGILQILEDRDLPKDVTKKLKTAQHSGVFLLTLVNQVLDFARIEAGAIETTEEDFTVGSLIGDLHSLFSVQSEAKQLIFDYTIDGNEKLWITACYSHIKQILFNLIGNAIKFTHKGAVTIKVEIEEGTLDSVNLVFCVSDTGPGISHDEQEMIFEPFKQSESGRKSSMGTGLGLSISKNLVQMMGGFLTVQSELGKGTTFKLEVGARISENQHIAEETDQKVPGPEKPMTILIAEDNSVNQMIVKEMLKGDGHSVTIVENGADAVEEIRRNWRRYDLIFMDIQMPVMNGVEATKAIRALIPDENRLPIYALTANAFKSQVEEYHVAGMQGALTKPIDRQILRQTLLKISEASTQRTSDGKTLDDMEVLPVILDTSKVDTLAELISNDRFRELIEDLNRTSVQILTAIAEPDLDPEELCELAHEIRGVANNVGLVRLALKAEELERKASSGNESIEQRQDMISLGHESLGALADYIAHHKPELFDQHPDSNDKKSTG